ncbi:MAG: hypothetical protein PQJ58_14205 [Spirochaetales bacterium]|nr:hypothetical protein [Spirochaetales bacterium]
MKKTMIAAITASIILLSGCASGGNSGTGQALAAEYTMSIDDADLSPMAAAAFTPVVADSTGSFDVEQNAQGLIMGGVPRFGNYASFAKPVAAEGFTMEFTVQEKSGYADRDGSWTSFCLMDAPLYIGQEGVNGMVLLCQPVNQDGREITIFNMLQQPGLDVVGSVVVDAPAEGNLFTVKLMKSDAGWIFSVNDIPQSISYDVFPEDMYRNNRAFFMTGSTSNIMKPSSIILHRLDDYKFYGAM